MMTDYYFDDRWIGVHGIGRFAKELNARLYGVSKAELTGKPTGMLDPLKSALWLARSTGSVFFSPGFNAPACLQARSIITLHDLIHLDIKEESNLPKKIYYSRVVKPACRKAMCVFTVSDFSRQRIIEWSGALPERVINVGNGVSDVFQNLAVGDEPPLASDYFFCVSNRKAHKNEVRLLEAFRQADIPEDVMLAITGKVTTEIRQHIERIGLSGRVHFTGPLDDLQLARYYRFAKALLFPSLYEGFGLPIVESMACGTPVLTSTVTSLPEVSGGAALLVNPRSTNEIASGISRLFEDQELRIHLSALGLERARHFSWDLVAKRVQATLDRWQ